MIATVTYSASAQIAPAARPVSTIHNDSRRIRQGVKNDELTRKETVRLKAEEARLKMKRKDYKQDGIISPAERRDLRKDKKRLSRNIYRQKHDGQTRP